MELSSMLDHSLEDLPSTDDDSLSQSNASSDLPEVNFLRPEKSEISPQPPSSSIIASSGTEDYTEEDSWLEREVDLDLKDRAQVATKAVNGGRKSQTDIYRIDPRGHEPGHEAQALRHSMSTQSNDSKEERAVDKTKEGGSSQCSCQVCGFKSEAQAVVVDHICHVHWGSSSAISKLFTFKRGQQEQRLTLEKDAKSKRFKCPYCVKMLGGKYNMQAHIRLHTGELPFKCNVCRSKKVSQYAIAYHIWKMHEDAAVNSCILSIEGSVTDDINSPPILEILLGKRNITDPSQTNIDTGEMRIRCEETVKDRGSKHKGSKCMKKEQDAAVRGTESGRNAMDATRICDGNVEEEALLQSTKDKPVTEDDNKGCRRTYTHKSTASKTDELVSGSKTLRANEVEGRTSTRLSPVSNQEVHSCLLCDFKSAKSGDLVKHICRKHKGNFSSVSMLFTFQRREIEQKMNLKRNAKSRLFKCPYCSKPSKTKQHMEFHIRVHTGERPYQCKTCGHKATQQAAVVQHIWHVHESTAIATCMKTELNETAATQCTQSVFDATINTRNMIVEFKGNLETTEVVDAQVTKQAIGVEKIGHGVSDVQNDAEQVQMTRDKRKGQESYDGRTITFKTTPNSNDKLIPGHKTISGLEETPSTRLEADDSNHVSTTDTHSCLVCDFKSAKQSDLVEHVRGHHKGTSFFVSKLFTFKCGEKERTMNLKQDDTSHDFECPYCSQKIHREDYMKCHIRIHTGECPYQCNLCGYKKNRKCLLVTHVWKAHETAAIDACIKKERGPVESDVTSKNIQQKWCRFRLCDFQTPSSAKLKQHIIEIHRSSSSAIGQCFTFKPGPIEKKLKLKRRARTGLFKCPYCSNTSKHKCSLIAHIRVHTCELPFRCRLCSRGASQKTQMVRHIWKMHKEDAISKYYQENKAAATPMPDTLVEETSLPCDTVTQDSTNSNNEIFAADNIELNADSGDHELATYSSTSLSNYQGFDASKDVYHHEDHSDKAARPRDKCSTSMSSGAEQGMVDQHLHPSGDVLPSKGDNIGRFNSKEDGEMTGEVVKRQENEQQMLDQHHHPSGDVMPSRGDNNGRYNSKKLVEGGEMAGEVAKRQENEQDIINPGMISMDHSVQRSCGVEFPARPLDEQGKQGEPGVDFMYLQSASEIILMEALLQALEFHCPYCGKQFKTAEDVVLHSRQHTLEKPYQCMHCGYRTAHKSPMEDHVKQHRPKSIADLITCKSASVKINEDFDQDPVTKKYVCCRCLKESTTLLQAKLHGVNHVKVYRCRGCDFEAPQKPAMVEHVQNSHSDLIQICRDKRSSMGMVATSVVNESELADVLNDPENGTLLREGRHNLARKLSSEVASLKKKAGCLPKERENENLTRKEVMEDLVRKSGSEGEGLMKNDKTGCLLKEGKGEVVVGKKNVAHDKAVVCASAEALRNINTNASVVIASTLATNVAISEMSSRSEGLAKDLDATCLTSNDMSDPNNTMLDEAMGMTEDVAATAERIPDGITISEMSGENEPSFSSPDLGVRVITLLTSQKTFDPKELNQQEVGKKVDDSNADDNAFHRDISLRAGGGVISKSEICVENEASIHGRKLDLSEMMPLTNQETDADAKAGSPREMEETLDERDDADDAYQEVDEGSDTQVISEGSASLEVAAEVMPLSRCEIPSASCDVPLCESYSIDIDAEGDKHMSSGSAVIAGDVTNIKMVPCKTVEEKNVATCLEATSTEMVDLIVANDSEVSTDEIVGKKRGKEGNSDQANLKGNGTYDDDNKDKDSVFVVQEIDQQLVENTTPSRDNVEGVEHIDGKDDIGTDMEDLLLVPDDNKHIGALPEIVVKIEHSRQPCFLEGSDEMNGMQVLVNSEKKSKTEVKITDKDKGCVHMKVEPKSSEQCEASIDIFQVSLKERVHRRCEEHTEATLGDCNAWNNDCASDDKTLDKITPEISQILCEHPHGLAEQSAEMPNMSNQVSTTNSNLNQSQEELECRLSVHANSADMSSSSDVSINRMPNSTAMNFMTRQGAPPVNEGCFTDIDAMHYRRAEERDRMYHGVNHLLGFSASGRTDMMPATTTERLSNIIPNQSTWMNLQPPASKKRSVDFFYAPSAGEKLVWDEQIVQCPVCSIEEDSTKDLMRHVREHHSGETPFRCVQCKFSSMIIETMVDHVHGFHPASVADLCHIFHICQWQANRNNGAKPCNPVASGKRACRPLNSDDEFYHCSSCGFKSFQLPLMVDHAQRVHKKCSYLEVDPSSQEVVCPVCLHHWDNVQNALSHTCSPSRRNMTFPYGEHVMESWEQRANCGNADSRISNSAEDMPTIPYLASHSNFVSSEQEDFQNTGRFTIPYIGSHSSQTSSGQQAFQRTGSFRRHPSSVNLPSASLVFHANHSPRQNQERVCRRYTSVNNPARPPRELQRLSQDHMIGESSRLAFEILHSSSTDAAPIWHSRMQQGSGLSQDSMADDASRHSNESSHRSSTVASPNWHTRKRQGSGVSQDSMTDDSSRHSGENLHSLSLVAAPNIHPRKRWGSGLSLDSMTDDVSPHSSENLHSLTTVAAPNWHSRKRWGSGLSQDSITDAPSHHSGENLRSLSTVAAPNWHPRKRRGSGLSQDSMTGDSEQHSRESHHILSTGYSLTASPNRYVGYFQERRSPQMMKQPNQYCEEGQRNPCEGYPSGPSLNPYTDRSSHHPLPMQPLQQMDGRERPTRTFGHARDIPFYNADQQWSPAAVQATQQSRRHRFAQRRSVPRNVQDKSDEMATDSEVLPVIVNVRSLRKELGGGSREK